MVIVSSDLEVQQSILGLDVGLDVYNGGNRDSLIISVIAFIESRDEVLGCDVVISALLSSQDCL
jgi:hypothetical protein